VARHADIVELSFANTARDVALLQEHLARLGSRQPAIVLKIETRRGFENLPDMLLTAMRAPCCGVMIARGDLAVECGFERLAEVQEEILWICEAAHVPVIWATQVLETLAKEGMPSRAEITDAAMGDRAECVMLNKGPYMVTAVRVLDGILRRMQAHQAKKRSMLRELHLAHALPPDRSKT
jgi:pyruvate kinase